MSKKIFTREEKIKFLVADMETWSRQELLDWAYEELDFLSDLEAEAGASLDTLATSEILEWCQKHFEMFLRTTYYSSVDNEFRSVRKQRGFEDE